MKVDGEIIRRTVLEVIREQTSGGEQHLQSGSVLQGVCNRIDVRGDIHAEQAVLTFWHDLFRSGYLAWGYNIINPNPPFCHTTELGRRALEHLSRDPSNPDGYLHHLAARASPNPIAMSYVGEALRCFNSMCFRACAVMIGVAAESLILDVRSALKGYLERHDEEVPRNLTDWKVKSIITGIEHVLEARKADLPRDLWDQYEAHWPAFTQQIRTVRNESGHPKNIEPVETDDVHASLLIFPQLAALTMNLLEWASQDQGHSPTTQP